MRHGLCVQCKKGTLFNCGSFYRCDFCGYNEPTLLASDLKVEGMTVWADAQLERWNNKFAVRPTQIFTNYPLKDLTLQERVDRSVYAVSGERAEQLSLFDTTDFIGFGRN